jgi:uncharacterized membrane protein YedE/YeeE
MRVLLTFVALLLLGSAALTLSWEDFTLARDGQAGARIVVFVGAGVGLLSLTLLARIIYRISKPIGLREDR